MILLKIISLSKVTPKNSHYKRSSVSFYELMIRVLVCLLIVDSIVSKNDQIFRPEKTGGQDTHKGRMNSNLAKFSMMTLPGQLWVLETLSEDQIGELDVLFNSDPTLFRQIRGKVTLATFAAREGKIKALQELYRLDPTLLSQKDEFGRIPATAAAYNEDSNVLKALYRLNPELLNQKDGRGKTAINLVIANSGDNDKVLNELLDFDPTLFKGHSWELAMRSVTSRTFLSYLCIGVALPSVVICAFILIRMILDCGEAAVAFLNPHLPVLWNVPQPEIDRILNDRILDDRLLNVRILNRRNPPDHPTIINVHNGSRDKKTLDAYRKLYAHVGQLPGDYFRRVFIPDLGLKHLNLSLTTIAEMALDPNEYYNKIYYLFCLGKSKPWLYLEFVLEEIQQESTMYRMIFYKIPEIGYPSDSLKESFTLSDKLTYQNQHFDPKFSHFFTLEPPTLPSLISEAFQKDPKFRYSLGFATQELSLTKPFYPIIFQRFPLSSGQINGLNLLNEAYQFCKMSSNSDEIKLREAAYINGMKHGIEPLAEDPKKLYRLCEQGQTQYLLSTLIQGRLEGVMIDDTSMQGLEAVIPSVKDLVTECCLNAEKHQKYTTQKEFMDFVTDDYCRNNPFLSGDRYPELKKGFWEGIEVVSRYLDQSEEHIIEDIVPLRPDKKQV